MNNISNRIKILKLDNGFHCYVVRKPDQADDISVCLTVKAGSAYEKMGESGWFHFLEHLLIYPSLYKCVESDDWDGKFLAFDYAYTSFEETAFWFQGTDSTGELLIDSIKTATGILKGVYLREEAFACTREDILCEYMSFTRKNWFHNCLSQLREKKISMPVGNKEDILRADYERLVFKHREYYRPDNSALIISSGREVEEIQQILEEIYRKQSCLFLAWLKRIPLSIVGLVRNYMEMAITARAVEAVFQTFVCIDKVECEVEIFQQEEYLFKLSIVRKEKLFGKAFPKMEIINEVPAFSENLFLCSKEAVHNQLDVQYGVEHRNNYSWEIMNCCREHFMFDEPILDFDNEYEMFCESLENCRFKDVKQKYESVMEQFRKAIKD